jgi:hypothetical protein
MTVVRGVANVLADRVTLEIESIAWPSWSGIKRPSTSWHGRIRGVAIIPGPIGSIAAGVAAVSYAATGNWKQAAIMTACVAGAFVGAGVVAVAAVGAVKVAGKGAPIVGKVASKVAPAIKTAAATIGRAARPVLKGWPRRPEL